MSILRRPSSGQKTPASLATPVVPGAGMVNGFDLKTLTVQNDNSEAPCAACGARAPLGLPALRHTLLSWRIVDGYRLMLCIDARACRRRWTTRGVAA